MESARRKKLMWRWAIIAAGLTAVFWTIWWLSAGSVPVVSQTSINPETTERLPSGISRWWDILFAPFFAVLILWLETAEVWQEGVFWEEVIERRNWKKAQSFWLAWGVAFGFTIWGSVGGLAFGLALAMFFSSVLILGGVGILRVLNLGSGLGTGLGLGIGIHAGLGLGLIYGFLSDLALIAGLLTGFGLRFGLKVIKYLFSRRCWKTVFNWLSAKETNSTKDY